MNKRQLIVYADFPQSQSIKSDRICKPAVKFFGQLSYLTENITETLEFSFCVIKQASICGLVWSNVVKVMFMFGTWPSIKISEIDSNSVSIVFACPTKNLRGRKSEQLVESSIAHPICGGIERP